jgi:hypothetical protein
LFRVNVKYMGDGLTCVSIHEYTTCTSSVCRRRSTRSFWRAARRVRRGHQEAERWQYVRRPGPIFEGAIPHQ